MKHIITFIILLGLLKITNAQNHCILDHNTNSQPLSKVLSYEPQNQAGSFQVKIVLESSDSQYVISGFEVNADPIFTVQNSQSWATGYYVQGSSDTAIFIARTMCPITIHYKLIV